MCLDSNAEFMVSTDIGYKYFRPHFMDINKLLPQFSGREFQHLVYKNNDGPYSFKEWINDTSTGQLPYSQLIHNEFSGMREVYQSGFHIYVYAPTSPYNNEVIRYDGKANLYKIEYKNIVAKGIKDGRRVIVARSMRILYQM